MIGPRAPEREPAETETVDTLDVLLLWLVRVVAVVGAILLAALTVGLAVRIFVAAAGVG